MTLVKVLLVVIICWHSYSYRLSIMTYLASPTQFILAFLPWLPEVVVGSNAVFHDVYRKGYALLINTWKRNDLLKQSISHYASCPGLTSIHIVWSEPDPPSVSLIKYLNHVIESNSRDGQQIELKFDINREDSLNNRFKEIKNLKTDALFSIDDDVIFPCSSVELAFSIWQSAPDTMVGFVPRMHWVDRSVCLLLFLFFILTSGYHLKLELSLFCSGECNFVHYNRSVCRYLHRRLCVFVHDRERERETNIYGNGTCLI